LAKGILPLNEFVLVSIEIEQVVKLSIVLFKRNLIFSPIKVSEKEVKGLNSSKVGVSDLLIAPEHCFFGLNLDLSRGHKSGLGEELPGLAPGAVHQDHSLDAGNFLLAHRGNFLSFVCGKKEDSALTALLLEQVEFVSDGNLFAAQDPGNHD